jgi:tRNA (guanosine-2'-O-)-methyltransferase
VTGGQDRRQLRPTDVKRLNRDWRRQTEGGLALLLDSVGQPFNVGSIVRSAAAFGAGHLWLCGNTAPLDHPSARKTALGTERFLTSEREQDPAAAAKAARAAGFRVVAVELASGAVPLHEAPLDGDICLAVGNEDHGCCPALLAAADAVTYIPPPSRVGSLNVAVAAAIAMAEVRRREWARLPLRRLNRAYSPRGGCIPRPSSPPGVRAPRRGGRRAGEHHGAVPARGRTRLPIHGDRRPRHGGRPPRRLP